MTIPEASASTTTRAGRERTCAQCSGTYRAPRATSRYCSPRCRQRGHRGASDTDGKTLDLFRRWLLRRTYAGQIGPVNRRDPRPPVYALTVPSAFVLEEWSTWNPGASMTSEAFATALDRLSVYGPAYLPPHKQR
jgi:hypothetical protein